MYEANQAAMAHTAARVVVDDRKFAFKMGVGSETQVWAPLPFMPSREKSLPDKPGREKPQQITIFGSVGVAFQDMAAGWLAYNSALDSTGTWNKSAALTPAGI